MRPAYPNRGVLLGVRPRPAPPAGAGPLSRNTPPIASRDMSRRLEGLQRHVASVPPPPDGTSRKTVFGQGHDRGSSRDTGFFFLREPCVSLVAQSPLLRFAASIVHGAAARHWRNPETRRRRVAARQAVRPRIALLRPELRTLDAGCQRSLLRRTDEVYSFPEREIAAGRPSRRPRQQDDAPRPSDPILTTRRKHEPRWRTEATGEAHLSPS
jgi:hypothetical protein